MFLFVCLIVVTQVDCLVLDCVDVLFMRVQGILRVGLGDEIGTGQFMAAPLMPDYRYNSLWLSLTWDDG